MAEDYEPVEFFIDQNEIIAIGDIDESAIDSFEKITAENPHIKTLILQLINGSVDDDANLELSRMVYDAGFTTVVPYDGLVASGGTDLFLAGKKRMLEEGACVGVHSWSDDFIDGADLPKTAPDHAPYLDYFKYINVSEDFYWFTLKSAPASNMYWMNQNEAKRYSMTTNPTPVLGSKKECDLR